MTNLRVCDVQGPYEHVDMTVNGAHVTAGDIRCIQEAGHAGDHYWGQSPGMHTFVWSGAAGVESPPA